MDESNFYSGIRNTINVDVSREEVFGLLEADGVDRAVVEFSGGHDEGGTEEIRLEVNGVELKTLREYISAVEIGPDGKVVLENHIVKDQLDGKERIVSRPKSRELTEEERAEMRLARSLAAPVYDTYGGFAGDFTVSGEVEWRVWERRVLLNGRESFEEYEEIEMEF